MAFLWADRRSPGSPHKGEKRNADSFPQRLRRVLCACAVQYCRDPGDDDRLRPAVRRFAFISCARLAVPVSRHARRRDLPGADALWGGAAHASTLVGALFLPTWMVSLAVLVPTSFGPRLQDVLSDLPLTVPFGGLLGYCTGTLAAGVFLVTDALQTASTRQAETEPVDPDLLPFAPQTLGKDAPDERGGGCRDFTERRDVAATQFVRKRKRPSRRTAWRRDRRFVGQSRPPCGVLR